MRKRIGIVCVIMGFACFLLAGALIIYNDYEADRGEETSRILLQTVQTNMLDNVVSDSVPNDMAQQSLQVSSPKEMPTVSAGNYESIGILSIPVLELELPVLTDWSYEKLTKAPCHYYGSYYESDFVIAAHNYSSHFGRLSQLHPGDLVIFTDVTGEVYRYQVVLLETLTATATEEMITSGFDLSLYTCTPGGGSRITVRCTEVKL